MNLRWKKDDELISELKLLVQKEREVLAQILAYIRELDSRKLYLERGYPSLFEMLTRELGYSAASAQRRIEAARLIRALPEVERKIESGELSLSVVAQAQQFFRHEEQRLRSQEGMTLSLEEKREVVESLVGLSTRECERKLAELSPEVALPKERTQALSGQRTLVQFVADEALMEKFDRLQELLSHKLDRAKYADLFHELADIALKKLTPKKCGDQAALKPGERLVGPDRASSLPAPEVAAKKQDPITDPDMGTAADPCVPSM